MKKSARPRRSSASAAAPARYNGISSDAVHKATGRTWDEWLAILDRDNASALPHKQIAVLLSTRHNVGPWWAQMVTVGYEHARGLREKHQTPRGYQVSASKTIHAPVARAFDAWTTDAVRRRWLPDEIIIRKATPSRSARIIWPDSTGLSVNFYPKGAGKCQVTVDHNKIRTRALAEKYKAYWADRIVKLKELLEG